MIKTRFLLIITPFEKVKKRLYRTISVLYPDQPKFAGQLKPKVCL